MKKPSVTMSGKYQVVIPKAARKKMGLEGQAGRQLDVVRVTKDEIVFRKREPIESYFGAFSGAWGPNPTKRLRKMRDEEWD